MANSSPPAATAAEAIVSAVRRLAQSGIAEARAEATALVRAATGASRETLLSHPEAPLSPHEMKRFESLVARRAMREPLPYITGETEFYSLRFRVTPSAIVPRPETEILAEAAIRRAGARGARSAIDVGTGAGGLPVAMVRDLPGLRVVATDISLDALLLARENCRRHQVADSVALLCADLLAAVRDPADFIVANLPYVGSDEFPDLQPEVRDFEPRIALDGGSDGLAHIRRLSAQLRCHLSPGGFAALEVGAGQAAEVAKLLVAGGLDDIEMIRDYSGVERVVVGWRRA